MWGYIIMMILVIQYNINDTGDIIMVIMVMNLPKQGIWSKLLLISWLGCCTFSLLSGKKFMPLGTSNAIRAAATLRTVCRNTLHDFSSSDCRHPYGQPRITVLGFIPPRPVVWILNTRYIITHFQQMFQYSVNIQILSCWNVRTLQKKNVFLQYITCLT